VVPYDLERSVDEDRADDLHDRARDADLNDGSSRVQFSLEFLRDRQGGEDLVESSRRLDTRRHGTGEAGPDQQRSRHQRGGQAPGNRAFAAKAPSAKRSRRSLGSSFHGCTLLPSTGVTRSGRRAGRRGG
jgi:hypothetical protein